MSSDPYSSSNSMPSTSSQYAPYFPLPFHLQQNPHPQFQYVQPPTVKLPSQAYANAYSLPQYQQAQQLFERDAQTITPEALESVKAALANSEVEHKAETKKKAIPRKAAGQSWEDPTLAEWPEDDYRLFCGDLGNEVNDDVLTKAFSRFPSFNMARENMLEIGQSSCVKVIGRTGQMPRLWKGRRTTLTRNQNWQRKVFCTNEFTKLLASGAISQTDQANFHLTRA